MSLMQVEDLQLRAALERAHLGESPRMVLAELCALSRELRPGVGQTVHVRSGGRCRAALVTEDAGEDTLHLCVLTPEGIRLMRNVHPAHLHGEDGTWHWPESRTAQK